MSELPLLEEPGRIEEPQAGEEYADMLRQVAAAGRPVIVSRQGKDIVAVIPLQHLEQVREILARQEVEKLAAQIDWERARTSSPPQSWFDDNDNPFEPEEGPPS